MDWFERLTGFREQEYAATRALLDMDGGVLRSKRNGKSFAAGVLELPSLAELRKRVRIQSNLRRAGLRFSNVGGDVRKLHRDPQYAGALFQVASQFNMLEMVGPSVTPEHGVTRYESDHTQGPACAIAAGAATIYRNYFAPVGDKIGQTANAQLDGLADLGTALATQLNCAVADLYEMRNGYALCTEDGLAAISAHLVGLSDGERDQLRGLLRIGLHSDVQVTDGADSEGQLVSQAFCSALPVSYGGPPQRAWEPFARLVLEAAYEATLLAAAERAAQGGSNVVLLTRLGGGAFGNGEEWIDEALARSLHLASDQDLDVRLVSYGSVPSSMRNLESALSRAD